MANSQCSSLPLRPLQPPRASSEPAVTTKHRYSFNTKPPQPQDSSPTSPSSANPKDMSMSDADPIGSPSFPSTPLAKDSLSPEAKHEADGNDNDSSGLQLLAKASEVHAEKVDSPEDPDAVLLRALMGTWSAHAEEQTATTLKLSEDPPTPIHSVDETEEIKEDIQDHVSDGSTPSPSPLPVPVPVPRAHRPRAKKQNRKQRRRREKRKQREEKKYEQYLKKSSVVSRRKDPLLRFDPSLAQPPTAADFAAPYGLARKDYRWGRREVVESQGSDGGSDLDEGIAGVPCIADPYDDVRRVASEQENEGMAEEEEEEEGEEEGEEEQVPRPRRQPNPTKPSPPQPPKGSFMLLPLEIRSEIYRLVLVVPQPILVRSGWRRVYARSRPGISTAILRSSRAVYAESVRVLYSQNTFLYRLRDPLNRVVNIEELPAIDHETGEPVAPEEEDEEGGEGGEFVPDGGEYEAEDEEEVEHVSSSRRRRRRGRDASGVKNDTIDIQKFGPLFRRLVVEAERNRFASDTQTAMAEAIKVFTAQPGTLKKARVKTAIHTFTIRVAPKFLGTRSGNSGGEGDEREGDEFTFVDFFRPDTPVWRALKALPCRFIRIDILLAFLNNNNSSSNNYHQQYHQQHHPPRPLYCRLTMDVQALGFARSAARQRAGAAGAGAAAKAKAEATLEFWRQDCVMREQRRAKAQKGLEAMHRLERHVREACGKHLCESVRAAAVADEEGGVDGTVGEGGGGGLLEEDADWGLGGDEEFDEFVPDVVVEETPGVE